MILLLVMTVCIFGEGISLADTFASYLAEAALLPAGPEGSKTERVLLQWIMDFLEGRRIEYSVKDFNNAWESHSFSASLEVDLPGKNPDTLIIALPLSAPPAAQTADTGGNAGIVTALTALEYFAAEDLPISLKFLFLGAESGPDETYPLGTRHYLREYYSEHPVSVLYLDIPQVPRKLSLGTGGSRISAPLWLLKSCTDTLREEGIDFDFSVIENLLSRFGALDTVPVIDPYLQAGYPTLLLRQHGPGGGGPEWIVHFISFLESFMGKHRNGFPTTWDRHYLYLQFSKNSLAINESAYITGLLILLCLVAVYPLVYTGRFKRYLKTLRKNILFLPALLIAVFCFLLIGTFLAGIIPKIKHFPDIWTYAPFLFFLFKCVGAVLLFMILFHFVRHIPFPRNSSFYSAAAVLFLLLDIIILSLVDLTFTVYVSWAFIFAFLFTVLPNRYLKIIMFLLSLSWLLVIMYDIFTLPALRVCRILIYSTVRGNFLLAFMLLPFLFMFIRIDLLFAHRRKKTLNIVLRIAFGFLAGAFICLSVYLFLFDPFGKNNPQPISVTEHIEEGNHTLAIESPAPIVGSDISNASFSPVEYPVEKFIRVDTAVDTFLDRMNIVLTIHTRGNPEKIELQLVSDSKIIIYDASFPYSIDPASGIAVFYIGTNPPADLRFELTLPSILEGRFDINLLYRRPETDFTLSGHFLTLRKILDLKTEIPLRIDTPVSME